MYLTICQSCWVVSLAVYSINGNRGDALDDIQMYRAFFLWLDFIAERRVLITVIAYIREIQFIDIYI